MERALFLLSFNMERGVENLEPDRQQEAGECQGFGWISFFSKHTQCCQLTIATADLIRVPLRLAEVVMRGHHVALVTVGGAVATCWKEIDGSQ